MFFQGNEKYNCATYLRLSRSDGDQQESNSIKNQRALLNDYMGKHPELHKFDEYVDDGYSGTNFERPDFKRMMQDIEKRNVNCIIVKDLSRFGRNYIETGRYLERIFPFMGVRFIAINDHYVEDYCKAIDLIIHKGRVGEVYNVGGHNEKQNIEIVKIICKELGKPESLITHVGDRKGHDMRYAIDPTKIHNELGWLPETKFEDGIKKTIQWYLDNREWWETIISGEYQNYYEKMYSNR